mmetsp:Transcript_162/g.381  ORF Transcript_162/g.381 Transcript_162/m.381 type:complete len:201 (-) Transcript_162:594-1196(-)
MGNEEKSEGRRKEIHANLRSSEAVRRNKVCSCALQKWGKYGRKGNRRHEEGFLPPLLGASPKRKKDTRLARGEKADTMKGSSWRRSERSFSTKSQRDKWTGDGDAKQAKKTDELSLFCGASCVWLHPSSRQPAFHFFHCLCAFLRAKTPRKSVDDLLAPPLKRCMSHFLLPSRIPPFLQSSSAMSSLVFSSLIPVKAPID